MCMRPDGGWHPGHAQSKFTAPTASLPMDAERRVRDTGDGGVKVSSKMAIPRR